MWLLAGAGAFFLAIATIWISRNENNKCWPILMFLSLSLGLISMVSSYHMVFCWVNAGAWGSLMDVVPSMDAIFILAVLTGVGLNLTGLILNMKKDNK